MTGQPINKSYNMEIRGGLKETPSHTLHNPSKRDTQTMDINGMIRKYLNQKRYKSSLFFQFHLPTLARSAASSEKELHGSGALGVSLSNFVPVKWHLSPRAGKLPTPLNWMAFSSWKSIVPSFPPVLPEWISPSLVSLPRHLKYRRRLSVDLAPAEVFGFLAGGSFSLSSSSLH